MVDRLNREQQFEKVCFDLKKATESVLNILWERVPEAGGVSTPGWTDEQMGVRDEWRKRTRVRCWVCGCGGVRLAMEHHPNLP